MCCKLETILLADGKILKLAATYIVNIWIISVKLFSERYKTKSERVIKNIPISSNKSLGKQKKKYVLAVILDKLTLWILNLSKKKFLVVVLFY